IGAGKASAAMARAFETAWPGALQGIVVTRHGHGVPCERVRIVEASHPVPDRAGEQAARDILDLAQGLGPEDQLVCLVSGGGSALLTLPAPGLSLAEARAGLAKYRIEEPDAVLAHLAAAAEETPKPGDPAFARARFELIASPQQALAAAADAALARNITPIVLSDRIEGEARDVAAVHAAIALQLHAGRLRVG